MFASTRWLISGRTTGALRRTFGATVFTMVVGTTFLVENSSGSMSLKINNFPSPISFLAKRFIGMSECHAAGDSCCKEPAATAATVVSEKPKEAVSKVVEVTTETFEQVVLKSDKDVFVVFYAPWCGYCKRLVPVWQELAEEISGTSSVVVAQVDMTQHSVSAPGVVIHGYPTIYLFKNGRKEAPIEYRGARDVASFGAFLEFYTNM